MKLLLATMLLAAPLLAGASAADPVPDLFVCTPESADTCRILNDPVDTAVGVIEDPPQPEPCRIGGQDWC